MADPSVMFNQPNPGDRFAQGFQQGQERAKQNKLKAAMAALARDPNNQKAFEVLSEVAPEQAMQIQQQRQQQSMKALEGFQGTIKQAAEMAQNLKQQNPNMPDEQVYANVRRTLIGLRMPGAEQAPEQFDPQYFQGILSLANPQKPDNGPSSYQEFQLSQKDPAYAKHLEDRRGPLIANNGDGTFTVIPRAAVQGGGAVPPPPPGFELDGGPTPPASGNFPESHQ